MNWMRRTVLGRVVMGVISRTEGLEADFSALERRVTSLEAKLHAFTHPQEAPPITAPTGKGPDLSPLGNFKAAGAQGMEIVPVREVISQAKETRAPAKLISIFGGTQS